MTTTGKKSTRRAQGARRSSSRTSDASVAPAHQHRFELQDEQTQILHDLLATGLYGTTLEEVAHGLISRAIRDEVRALGWYIQRISREGGRG